MTRSCSSELPVYDLSHQRGLRCAATLLSIPVLTARVEKSDLLPFSAFVCAVLFCKNYFVGSVIQRQSHAPSSGPPWEIISVIGFFWNKVRDKVLRLELVLFFSEIRSHGAHQKAQDFASQ